MQSICVMGLGYIGLPTSSVLATYGYHVLGVDVNPSVVETVNRGDIHIEEPGLQTVVKAATQSGQLRAATEPAKADIYIIAVPTPLTDDKKADMSYVRKATEAIVPLLEPGALVILESTSPPGTCRDLLLPILEQGGLRVGADIFLAHCPERVLPGRILREFIANDRVVGGFDRASAQRARDMYATFVEGDILLTDMTTAELVKVLENTYRDVNIALANETAVLCEKLGIDFAEAMRLSNRHPRVNVHQAGPGVGGHCISVDPWFLVEAFPEDTPLIHQARLRNDSMPQHVADATEALLAGEDKPKVAALGLAFKGNVDDLRGSPSLTVVKALDAKGFEVAVHDPYVKHAPMELQSLEDCIRDADCLLVLTDHNDYKYLSARQVAKSMRRPLLFDTRNMLEHDDWREAGFQVRVLGVGPV